MMHVFLRLSVVMAHYLQTLLRLLHSCSIKLFIVVSSFSRTAPYLLPVFCQYDGQCLSLVIAGLLCWRHLRPIILLFVSIGNQQSAQVLLGIDLLQVMKGGSPWGHLHLFTFTQMLFPCLLPLQWQVPKLSSVLLLFSHVDSTGVDMNFWEISLFSPFISSLTQGELCPFFLLLSGLPQLQLPPTSF